VVTRWPEAIPERSVNEAASRLGGWAIGANAGWWYYEALTLVIPVSSTFISLFKDTTLVSLLACFDILGGGAVDASLNQLAQRHYGRFTSLVGLLFSWIFCFGNVRYKPEP